MSGPFRILRGAAFFVGTVGSGLFFWHLFYADDAQKDLLRQRSKQEQILMDINRGKAAERKIVQLKEEMKKLNLELEKLDEILPEKPDRSKWEPTTRGRARRAGVRIESITVGPPESRQLVMTPVRLRATGPPRRSRGSPTSNSRPFRFSSSIR